MDYLHDMISKGHQPDVVTYNILIDGLYKNGEIETTVDFLHDMMCKGYEPDVVTFNTLIDGGGVALQSPQRQLHLGNAWCREREVV